MKRTFKKSASVFMAALTLFLLFAVPFSAGAKQPDGGDIAVPYYVNIKDPYAEISISGITASMKASFKSNSSTSLSIVMELQKLKSGTYQTIETYTKTGNGTSLSIAEDRLINLLSDYRLKVTFTAGGETAVQYKYP